MDMGDPIHCREQLSIDLDRVSRIQRNENATRYTKAMEKAAEDLQTLFTSSLEEAKQGFRTALSELFWGYLSHPLGSDTFYLVDAEV